MRCWWTTLVLEAELRLAMPNDNPPKQTPPKDPELEKFSNRLVQKGLKNLREAAAAAKQAKQQPQK